MSRYCGSNCGNYKSGCQAVRGLNDLVRQFVNAECEADKATKAAYDELNNSIESQNNAICLDTKAEEILCKIEEALNEEAEDNNNGCRNNNPSCGGNYSGYGCGCNCGNDDNEDELPEECNDIIDEMFCIMDERDAVKDRALECCKEALDELNKACCLNKELEECYNELVNKCIKPKKNNAHHCRCRS